MLTPRDHQRHQLGRNVCQEEQWIEMLRFESRSEDVLGVVKGRELVYIIHFIPCRQVLDMEQL